MEIINIHDINIGQFEKLPNQGTTSTVYKYQNTCYKLFHNLYYSERQDLYKKFQEIKTDNIKIEHAIFPQKFIMDDKDVKGYTTPYIPNSTSLFTKFLEEPEYLDIHAFFESMIKSNKILKQIHEKGIICQDLNFDNIIIDSNGECYFIDFDACSYGNNHSQFTARLLNDFFEIYRRENIRRKNIIRTKNLDQISMMISFFYFIFQKPIQYVSKQEYNEIAKHINSLNKLEYYANILLDKRNPIKYIPYLDELIDELDDYFIKIKK